MRHHHAHASRRGATLVMVTFAIAVLGMLSFSMMMVSSAATQNAREERREVAAMFVAEAGLVRAVERYLDGDPATLGNPDQPLDFGGASFRVEEVDLGNGLTSLVATGIDGGAESRVELVLHQGADPFFKWAAFGDEGLTLDSNARIDSYDSGLGAYDTQDLNGSGSNKYASTNGDVGSNADVSADSNVDVWGDAVPGPGHTATITGNAQVSGTTTPSSTLQDMPALVIPVGPSSGDLDVAGGDTVTIPPGTHFFDALSVDGLLEIQGPAVLVFDSAEINSNAEVQVDATSGGVEIFVLNDFVMNSNTLIGSTTKTPADIAINLNSDNVINPDLPVDLDEVDFDSNAKLYGTIYAPNAAVEINSNFELFGSLVARQVHLDSNARIHFDEALLEVTDDEVGNLQTVCWRVVPHTYSAQPAVAE